MRQRSTLNSARLLLVICTFFAGTLLYGNTGTDNTDTDKEQIKQENRQISSGTEERAQINATTSKDEADNQDEEVITTSDVSFNFVFYLIYKIKYAEIFKLPTRKREDARSSLNAPMLINEVLDRLIAPKL